MHSIVGIVGTGLIGASIGLRARQGGATVLGTDVSGDALEVARLRGAIDEAVSLDRMLAAANCVVIAAPVAQCVRVLAELGKAQMAAQLVLDVASVKTPVVRAARGIAPFVGTHPMAGSERTGPHAARADLFEGRPWAYIRSASPQLDARAVAFIEAMGGVPLSVDERAHDEAVAFTSHLPQLFATLFASELSRRGEPATQLCGPAARELQRLARSQFSIWRDIFEMNGRNVATELRSLARRFEETAASLERDDLEPIVQAFADAR